MNFEMPASLREEHEQLHGFLSKAAREEGKLGDAARLLARLLQPHFLKEESFALPALSLLAPLSRGNLAPEMAEVLAHTDWLKEHLDDMLAEHRMLNAALEGLLQAASAEKRNEFVEFAEKLLNHARMEEEILYPAAILVGQYLKTRLGVRV
jgi:hypothetical protein